MNHPIARGFALLNRVMEPAAAETVRYSRGGTVISEGLPATLSAQQIELVTEGGAAIIGRQFKWLLKRADLRVDNAEVRPEKFDRIEWNMGGRVYVFEVLPEIGSTESGAVDPRSDWIPASVKLIDMQ